MYLHSETIGPSFGIVAYHMFADPPPLREVLRWNDVHRRVVALDKVLDGNAQTEERFHAVFLECLQQGIGIDKAIALRIVLVGVEVGEYIGYVHEETSAEPAAHVV